MATAMAVMLGSVFVGAPLTADASQPPQMPRSAPTTPAAPGRAVTVGGRMLKDNGTRPTPPPKNQASGAHMDYYGGRVVSNVRVVSVLWGDGSYQPEVTATRAPNMDGFFTGITNSPYLDWLSEYNSTLAAANGGQGTNQVIGRGTFGGRFKVNPSLAAHATPCSAATGAAPGELCVDDSALRTELRAQINAGKLPAPETDAAGNSNTDYMLFFPRGTSVTDIDLANPTVVPTSGVDFCAYHKAIAAGSAGAELYYSVLPDNSTGTAMALGCGTAPTSFQNMTSYASHELLETITDPEVSLATSLAPPLGWYWNSATPYGGEIGDLCQGTPNEQTEITGGDGLAYTVQTAYSQAQNDCVALPPSAVTLGATPTSLYVRAGSTATEVVTTTLTSGPPRALQLSLAGLPAGMTGSVSAASVISGASATVTLNVSSGVAPGLYFLNMQASTVAHVMVTGGYFSVNVLADPAWRICWLGSCANGYESQMNNLHVQLPGARACRANNLLGSFYAAPSVGGRLIGIVDGTQIGDAANHEAFLVATDGNVYHNYELNPGSLVSPVAGWSTLGSPAAGIYGGVRIGNNYLNNQELYVRANDGQVYHLYATPGIGSGWQGWDPMGGPPGGIVGDVFEGTNYLHNQELYVLSVDGNVYHKFATPGIGSGWSNWDTMGHPDGVRIVGDVHIGINYLCNQELYVTGSDGNSYHNYSTPGQGTGWSGWGSLGRPAPGVGTDVAVGENPKSNQELFILGADNNVYHDYSTPGQGSGWSGWGSLGAPPASVISRFVWVDTYPSERLTVFTSAGEYANSLQFDNSWSGWTFVKPPSPGP